MLKEIAAVPTVAASAPGWSAMRGFVIAICFILNMLDGTDLLIMSFVAPVLASQWQITPERLGVLFSSSLLGMAIGCLLVAPLADRFGRRPLLLAALAATGLAMLASSDARRLELLMLCRLCVGIGVGTIGVTMTTMAAEYAPPRHAHFAVGFVQAGWPFGSILTALVAAQVLPAHSWQSLFLVIALLSAGLFVVIALVMPESLSYLETRQPANALERINAVRRRMRLPLTSSLPALEGTAKRMNVKALFKGTLRVQSTLLWCAVTLGYFDLYFVISWIPKLATQAGLPLAQAIYAGGSYNLGAFVGTAAVGLIATRWRLDRVVSGYFVAATVAMLIFGGIAMPVWATLGMAFLVGVSVQGGFNGFWALAASLYPAEIRNTGIGWALGVGRIGAVLGPIVGGVLVGAHMSLAGVFGVFAIPLAVAAILSLNLQIR